VSRRLWWVYAFDTFRRDTRRLLDVICPVVLGWTW
jgi:hypothetical protein